MDSGTGLANLLFPGRGDSVRPRSLSGRAPMPTQNVRRLSLYHIVNLRVYLTPFKVNYNHLFVLPSPSECKRTAHDQWRRYKQDGDM